LKNYKVILVGNYSKDRQISMNSFLNILASGLKNEGREFEVWKPLVCFGFFFNKTTLGSGKWFGYIDKYIITTIYIYLKVLIKKFTKINYIYHICDHSNAIYLPVLPNEQTLITCHDVIAIRGALGYKDSFCEASGFGKILQNQILKNLKNAKCIAMVSTNTKNQFFEIAPLKIKHKGISVIHNGLNQQFTKLLKIEIDASFSILPDKPFLFHVGSNLPRKNRILLLEILKGMAANFDGYLCLAGMGLDSELKKASEKLGLTNRIIVYEKPTHEVLNLLYNACYAFIFPSKSEGFGWPIIEAQACGAPVICSNIEPFIEIAGNSVLMADPTNSKEFIEQLVMLSNNSFRENLIAKGFQNCLKYTTEKMLSNYFNLYKNFSK
jgi:glycosyltransferase involved in cell wall biosynthesis